MSNPAITYAQPDVEAHLTGLAPAGVRLWVSAVDYRFPFWHATYTVNVVARGSSKAAASDAAQDAHDALLAAPHAAWADGVLLGVQTVDAPAWAPDANGAPAYAATYQVVARPRSET